jgi:hypothetical protein
MLAASSMLLVHENFARYQQTSKRQSMARTVVTQKTETLSPHLQTVMDHPQVLGLLLLVPFLLAPSQELHRPLAQATASAAAVDAFVGARLFAAGVAVAAAAGAHPSVLPPSCSPLALPALNASCLLLPAAPPAVLLLEHAWLPHPRC